MLKEFRVSNFKGFKDEFVFDLSEAKGYEFNPDCIKNGIVNNAIVYGHNGVGKSNLGLAIFDVIEHLTDKQKNEKLYKHYTNAYDSSNVAEFHYSFLIDGKTVVYEYGKTDYETLVFERFSIDNTELIVFDRRNANKQFTVSLKGAETLNKVINDSQLSALKYIKNNTSLVDNATNRTFCQFFDFIESMLFFRSLRENMFLGLESGSKWVFSYIIEQNKYEDLERFLNEAGIECKLSVVDQVDGKKELVFDFGKKRIPYVDIASTGTLSLVLFYFWFQRIKENKVKFVFIDEFDAFYHHELSELVVKELKKTGIQFILTTHNVSIMTNELLRPDCYFLMTKDKIRSLSNCTLKELREAHNIEKMYKAQAFNVE